MQRRAVFIDRDGVINSYFYHPEFGTVDSPSSPEEFQVLPGVPEAISRFREMGFLVLVISNQPGIAKGRFTPALLQATTKKMTDACPEIDAIYYCLHHPDASVGEYRTVCDCRKPKPGLLQKAAQEWNIDVKASYMIGDGIVDVQAGEAAGVKTVFVSSGKSYIFDELDRKGVKPDFLTDSLPEAVEVIRKVQNSPTNRHRQFSTKLTMNYTEAYLREAIEILGALNREQIERTADLISGTRSLEGRIFFLGVGGGAGHASHAVCDFRKIGGIEAYAPTDNVSELTARINDDGWETVYANWLRGSRLTNRDLVFVFSVGGGDEERNISANLVQALRYSKEVGASICGVVGRDGGYTAKVADACVLVPVKNPATVTPHTEVFQALVWHLLVSHPKLKAAEMKWESVAR